jgi:hypothetical protein
MVQVNIDETTQQGKELLDLISKMSNEVVSVEDDFDFNDKFKYLTPSEIENIFKEKVLEKIAIKKSGISI